MKKNNPPDGMPVWFDGKNINEALFCEEFLADAQDSSSQTGLFSRRRPCDR